MATTTNYGWETPDDTDLVKDGASAIRTLGSSIDTTTKNLNPQTTTGAIAYRSATSNVNTSLPIGTAGQILKVNSGATAPEWGAVSFVGCSLYNSGNISASNATDTAVTFDNEEFDTDGFHSTSTNTSRITIPTGKAGYYLFNAIIAYASNNTGQRYLNIFKNGAVVRQPISALTNTGGAAQYAASVILNLAVGDYVELYAYQTSGGSVNVVGGNSFNSTRFAATYLGA